jgi:hypothetical protein
MYSPAKGSCALSAACADGNIGSMTKVSVWFSEDITRVSGSVTLKNGAKTEVVGVISNWTNVSEASPYKMDITFWPLDAAGTLKVLIPAGSLKDEIGNHFTGANETGASAYSFPVAKSDTVKPSLEQGNVLPPKEDNTGPKFDRRTSDSIKLAFTETVQAGTGAVTFKSSYTSPNVEAPTKSEVFFSGSYAVVSPSSDFMAGEIYSMLLDGSAFSDVQGNTMVPLTGGFTISMAPLVMFQKVDPDTNTKNHWDSDNV